MFVATASSKCLLDSKSSLTPSKNRHVEYVHIVQTILSLLVKSTEGAAHDGCLFAVVPSLFPYWTYKNRGHLV